MGISSKHAYRFVYLRSDKWKDVRFEALAREGGRCQICSEEQFSNDAHHIFYPESVWGTTSDDLVILCRPCHEMIQEFFFQQSTRERGKKSFMDILTIIKTWVDRKAKWVEGKTVKSKIITPQTIQGSNNDYCHKCLKNSPPATSVDIFKELHINLTEVCSRRLCPRCLTKLKSEVSITPPPHYDAKRSKGFAFRAIRRWFDEPFTG